MRRRAVAISLSALVTFALIRIQRREIWFSTEQSVCGTAGPRSSGARRSSAASLRTLIFIDQESKSGSQIKHQKNDCSFQAHMVKFARVSGRIQSAERAEPT